MHFGTFRCCGKYSVVFGRFGVLRICVMARLGTQANDDDERGNYTATHTMQRSLLLFMTTISSLSQRRSPVNVHQTAPTIVPRTEGGRGRWGTTSTQRCSNLQGPKSRSRAVCHEIVLDAYDEFHVFGSWPSRPECTVEALMRQW